jgi:hypothetical protein
METRLNFFPVLVVDAKKRHIIKRVGERDISLARPRELLHAEIFFVEAGEVLRIFGHQGNIANPSHRFVFLS